MKLGFRRMGPRIGTRLDAISNIYSIAYTRIRVRKTQASYLLWATIRTGVPATT